MDEILTTVINWWPSKNGWSVHIGLTLGKNGSHEHWVSRAEGMELREAATEACMLTAAWSDWGRTGLVRETTSLGYAWVTDRIA